MLGRLLRFFRFLASERRDIQGFEAGEHRFGFHRTRTFSGLRPLQVAKKRRPDVNNLWDSTGEDCGQDLYVRILTCLLNYWFLVYVAGCSTGATVLTLRRLVVACCSASHSGHRKVSVPERQRHSSSPFEVIRLRHLQDSCTSSSNSRYFQIR